MKPKLFYRLAPTVGRATLPVLATAMIALAGTAVAVPTHLYWNGAAGTWNGLNWSTTSTGTGVSWTTGDLAVFDGVTAGTVSLASAVSVEGITFSTKGYTLKPTNNTSATSIITLGASGITIPSGKSTVQNIITGTNGLVLTGTGVTGSAGTLIVTAANTYTGDTALGLGAALRGSLPAASYLKLNGGIYETSGVSTFTRANSITQSGSNFTWSSAGGGFGAYGGKLTVTIGNNANTTQTWGTVAADNTIVGPLVLGAQDSDSETEFQNKIDLNGGTRTVTVPQAAAGSFATISGVISGTGASNLSKGLLGKLVLTAANTYAGTTTVSTGVLNIQNASALGTTGSGTSVSSGAALEIQNNITVGAEALTLSGTGDGTGTPTTGALRNISGNNTYGGLITLGSASRINSDSGTLTISNAGTITGSTFGLTVGGAGNTDITSIIGTGTGTLTKDGAGTLTLTGANTYTGGTIVAGGTLLVSNTSGSGTGTGTVTVNGGGTLGGSGGKVGGNVSVANLGKLAPGASIGTLTVGGNLTMATGSTFAYEMNSATHTSDLLVVQGAGGVTLGTNVELSLTDLGSGTFAPGTTLSLIQYEGALNSGLFTYNSSVLNNGDEFTDLTANHNHWTIHYNSTTHGDFVSGFIDPHFISLSLTAIPEVGGLLGLGCLVGSGVFVRSRRRGSNLL